MKVWKWHCNTHALSLLTMQTGNESPLVCSGFTDIVYPDDGPCFFYGHPVLSVYAALPS